MQYISASIARHLVIIQCIGASIPIASPLISFSIKTPMKMEMMTCQIPRKIPLFSGCKIETKKRHTFAVSTRPTYCKYSTESLEASCTKVDVKLPDYIDLSVADIDLPTINNENQPPLILNSILNRLSWILNRQPSIMT